MRQLGAIAIAMLVACGHDTKPADAPAKDAAAAQHAVDAAPVAKATPKGDCRADYAPKPDRDPSPMCKIDGGTFMMGAPADDADAAPNARPAHKVQLSPFYLDEFEVTNAQVAAYIATGAKDCDGAPCFPPIDPAHGAGHEHEPYTRLSAAAAAAYCAWAGRRLPTEAEWEFAARHDPATGKDLNFPWGDTFETDRDNCKDQFCKDGIDDLAPVGTFDGAHGHGDGRSPWGAQDLEGNAWEIVADCYALYKPCANGLCVDPRVDGPKTCLHVGRGTPSDGGIEHLTRRQDTPPYLDEDRLGFRCAR